MVTKMPNVEVTGAAPLYGAASSDRRERCQPHVGEAGADTPLFELCGSDGERLMLYEDGTATGFPDGTVIVNRAKPQLDLLRGRIKQLETALVADQQT